MTKFAQGKYVLKNPDKYIGNKTPTYRSSWEWAVMNMCDNIQPLISGLVKQLKYHIVVR